MAKQLRLPVVSLGAEYLVMGYLARRNILAYKAPPGNEGYDLICIHPDPRNKRASGKRSQLRIQVKSRYATDCDRGFPIKEQALDAFDFLIVAFLNIGFYKNRRDCRSGEREPEFYTLPATYVKQHHFVSGDWQKVSLRGREGDIEKYKNGRGFDLLARRLGIHYPAREI
jgi:hypothetical protein